MNKLQWGHTKQKIRSTSQNADAADVFCINVIWIEEFNPYDHDSPRRCTDGGVRGCRPDAIW